MNRRQPCAAFLAAELQKSQIHFYIWCIARGMRKRFAGRFARPRQPIFQPEP